MSNTTPDPRDGAEEVERIATDLDLQTAHFLEANHENVFQRSSRTLRAYASLLRAPTGGVAEAAREADEAWHAESKAAADYASAKLGKPRTDAYDTLRYAQDRTVKAMAALRSALSAPPDRATGALSEGRHAEPEDEGRRTGTPAVPDLPDAEGVRRAARIVLAEIERPDFQQDHDAALAEADRAGRWLASTAALLRALATPAPKEAEHGR